MCGIVMASVVMCVCIKNFVHGDLFYDLSGHSYPSIFSMFLNFYSCSFYAKQIYIPSCIQLSCIDNKLLQSFMYTTCHVIRIG